MASGRKKGSGRREPAFDRTSEANFRVDSRDRIGGASGKESRSKRAKPAGESGFAHLASRFLHSRSSKKTSGGSRPKRSRVGRLVYWTFVIGRGGVIAGIGGG
ncbi:MAG: hypothetical protein AB7K04_14160, partial [Pseudorhodoplanes sp.]